MDTKKIDRKIDTVAENAKETIALFSEKLDEATHCAEAKRAQVKEVMCRGVVKAADKVEEAVTAAANRVRAKAGK